MVQIGKMRTWLYRRSFLMITLSSISIAVLTFFNDVERSDKWVENKTFVWLVIERFQDYSGLLYLVLFSIWAFFTSIQKTKNPWVWEQLQFILDEYQGKVFTDFHDPQDYHRVTLFQLKKNICLKKHWSRTSKFSKPSGIHPLFSDYLVPVLRSGHLSKKSNAIFYVCDESDKCEGIAGQAWARQGSLHVTGLPEIKNSQAPKYIKAKKKYSEATYTDEALIEKYIKEGRPPPQSIAAMLVEVNSKPWGVIVLDSRSANGVSEDCVQNYTLTTAMIGRLLEEA